MKNIQTHPGGFLVFAFTVALVGWLTGGCATYTQQNKALTSQVRTGDVGAAATNYGAKAESQKNSKDAIIWRLEQAATLRAAGKFKESNDAFSQAEDGIDKYEESAKVKVGREALALLSNQANLPYEGRTYDGIMLNTYKALNYLQLGEPEKARVELIRAYQRQQDAVECNKRRIEKAQDEIENRNPKEKEQIQKAQEDTRLNGQISAVRTELDTLKAYSDYVNPFTVFLDGLFFMCNSADASDLERARKSYERLSGFAGDASCVKADLETINALLTGKTLEPTTYVIFETGRAPIRDQIRIDVPIIVSKVSYVGAAFPKLVFQTDYAPALQVIADGTNHQSTALIASMDSVIGLDFKNELPTIVAKTVASTVIKATAAYLINDAASSRKKKKTIADVLIEIGTKTATAAYQAAVNIADTRTWTTLPKEFHYCKFPTPADRKLDLQIPGGVQKASVTLCDATVNVVYVKSISLTAPLLVSQLKLK